MIGEIKYNFRATALLHFTDEEIEPGEGKSVAQGSYHEPVGELRCEFPNLSSLEIIWGSLKKILIPDFHPRYPDLIGLQ